MPDEFTFIPDWNAQVNSKSNVARVSFGDGYVQRQSKGMNPVQKTWSLTFNSRDEAEADAIEAFFESRYGVTAFTWTAPGMTQKKWTCEDWSRTVIGNDVSNISCTFTLVYEP